MLATRSTLPSGTPVSSLVPDGAVRGLVICPDIAGLRPLFDGMVEHLAAEHTWAVAAVEPFPGAEDTSVEDRLESVVATLSDQRVLGDLVDAADLLGVEPVAVTGFCMGGMYALKAAGHGRFDRAVAFYGMIRLPEGWRGEGQGEPLDAVGGAGACPTLAIVGGQDRWTPPPDVEALEAAGVTVARYPDADHGFVHDPARPAHRAADAEDAWSRLAAFLS